MGFGQRETKGGSLLAFYIREGLIDAVQLASMSERRGEESYATRRDTRLRKGHHHDVRAKELRIWVR